MSKLNLMSGIPGSGKSYWCHHHMTNKDIYISRDIVRFSMLNDEDDYFAKENEVFKEFIKQIQNAIDSNKYDNIFIDATHLNKSSRNKIFYNIEIKNIEEINLIYLNTPLEIAIERNSKRTGRKYVPENVIKNMYNSFKLPLLEEEPNFNNVYIINIDKPIQILNFK